MTQLIERETDSTLSLGPLQSEQANTGLYSV